MFRHLYLWAGCLLLSVLLLSGVYLYQSATISAQEDLPGRLRDAASNLGIRIDGIKQLQVELDNLTRQEFITDAVGGKQPYSQILLKLSGLLNNQTWFRQILAVSGPEKGSPVRLQVIGYSISNEVLGDFMAELSIDPTFDEVILSYAREATLEALGPQVGGSQTVIQFLIDCKVL